MRRFRPEGERLGAWVEEALAQGHAVFAQAAGTMRSRSDEWLANVAASLPDLLAHGSVASLAGSARGLEALVVGSGPSVDRLGDRLYRAAEGRVVVAVGSVLGALQTAGIDPQLTVLIEGADCSEQLAPPVDLTPTTLVLAQHGHPEHVRAADGAFLRIDLVENGWFADWLGEGPSMTSGGNVGSAAVALGCRRTLLAGLDFAELSKGERAEGARGGAFEAQRGEWVDVRGVCGGTVRSTQLMVSYRVSLERFLSGAVLDGAEFGNLGDEGCASIEGAPTVAPAPVASTGGEADRFADLVLERACQRPERSIAALRDRLEAFAAEARATLEPDARPALLSRLAERPGSLAQSLSYGHVALSEEGDLARVLEGRGERLEEWLREMERSLVQSA